MLNIALKFETVWGILIVSVLVLLVVICIVFLNKKKGKNNTFAVENFESEAIQKIAEAYSDKITSAFLRVNSLYSNIIKVLSTQNHKHLKKSQKRIKKLQTEMDGLRKELFVHLKDNEDSKTVNQFYVLMVENLEEMVFAMARIVKTSDKHLRKERKKLTFNQIRELNTLDEMSCELFNSIETAFSQADFDGFDVLSAMANRLLESTNLLLDDHIDKVNSTKHNPKNFKLYTKLLKRSRDLFTQTEEILNRYKTLQEDEGE